MDFNTDIFSLDRPSKVTFNLVGSKLPNSNDVYFRAKQRELVEQYSAARIFMHIKKWWYEIQNEYLLTDGPFTYMNPSAKAMRFSLNDYRCELLGRCEFHPWEGFSTEWRPNKNGHLCCELVRGSSTPRWWSAYNAVKHNRISIGAAMTNYDKANLGNVASAFAGLYILERAFMDSVGCEEDLQSFVDISRLFVKPRRLTFDEMDQLYK